MKWFKHMADAWDDERMALVIDEHGLAGYGFFWRLVEIVAKQMECNGDPACAFPVKKWSKMFGVYPKVFTKFCETLSKHSLIILKTSENISESSSNVLRIEIPMLLKLKDNHSRNLQAKNKIKNIDIDINITPLTPLTQGDDNLCETKETQKAEAKPTKPKPADTKSKPIAAKPKQGLEPVLPEWIPVDAWRDYIEFRKSIKKPMTAVAQKRALLELERLKNDGDNPGDVLNQSIINGWQGIFPIKNKRMKTVAAFMDSSSRSDWGQTGDFL